MGQGLAAFNLPTTSSTPWQKAWIWNVRRSCFLSFLVSLLRVLQYQELLAMLDNVAE